MTVVAKLDDYRKSKPAPPRHHDQGIYAIDVFVSQDQRDAVERRYEIHAWDNCVCMPLEVMGPDGVRKVLEALGGTALVRHLAPQARNRSADPQIDFVDTFFEPEAPH